jgi:hypothetical protein
VQERWWVSLLSSCAAVYDTTRADRLDEIYPTLIFNEYVLLTNYDILKTNVVHVVVYLSVFL